MEVYADFCRAAVSRAPDKEDRTEVLRTAGGGGLAVGSEDVL